MDTELEEFEIPGLGTDTMKLNPKIGGGGGEEEDDDIVGGGGGGSGSDGDGDGDGDSFGGDEDTTNAFIGYNGGDGDGDGDGDDDDDVMEDDDKVDKDDEDADSNADGPSDDSGDEVDNEDEDEDDIEDTNKFKKFNTALRTNYITEMHPESASHNDDEIHSLAHVVRDQTGAIIDPLHRTIPILTKYEKTRILGVRTKQINEGAPPYVSVKSTIIDGYIIAMRELEEKKIPFIVRRPLPNGGSEYWYLQDLEII